MFFDAGMNYWKSLSAGGRQVIPIKYIYCNPQMNRLLGELKTGEIIDVPFTILDLYWVSEVTEYQEPILEITMDDIEEKFGQKVKIINQGG